MSNSLADTYRPNKMTISSYMRRRRFKLVNNLIQSVINSNGKCNLLDIGGSEYYWMLNREFLDNNVNKIRITLTNIDENEISVEKSNMFKVKHGDAMSSELYVGDYNLIHSNSVIEHVGNWGVIRRIATNIVERDAPYYIQTPNYWFPIEPHFRMIGFQWLSLSMRARLLLKRSRGFRSAKTFDEAMDSVQSVNLLTYFQMKELFPDAEIVRERLGPLTKSFMAIRWGSSQKKRTFGSLIRHSEAG